MDTEPPEPETQTKNIGLLFILALDINDIWWLATLIILLILSALISGSEVAYFSIGKKQIKELEDEEDQAGSRVLALLTQPGKLLATILVSNNFINIAIVLVSYQLLSKTIPEQTFNNWANATGTLLGIDPPYPNLINFYTGLITVVLVTFILVLFGEVAPKVYSKANNLRMAKFMSFPLQLLFRIFSPITSLMEKGRSTLEKRIDSLKLGSSTTKEELDKAIDLTTDKSDAQSVREHDILKRLVKFNDVVTKEIMKSRVDVFAIDADLAYDQMLTKVKSSGYSRTPVFKEDLDNVVGILYVKDLLGHLNEGNDFDWQSLVRTELLYVPESKKIRELLTEFQEKRMHLALVVDEYGGTAGIVTLEDVMEEVVGEIKDEFDSQRELVFEKIDKDKFIFEGKTLLNDVCKILGEDSEVFDDYKGESDSIAGLFLEVFGILPKKYQVVNVGRFNLKATAVSKRRIERVMITREK